MLFDHLGRPLELLSAIADRETAGDYFHNFLGALPDPDPILRKMPEGPQILSDLEADEQVTAMTLARKNRVLNRRDYWFKPGALKDRSPTPIAELLCDRLVKDLERLTLREVISGILEAPFYGLAVLEITWETAAAWWHVKGLELKPPHWFGFNRDNQLVFKGENIFEARPLPEGKFILARHYPTYQNPYGLRLLSRCLWPVTFKKGGLTFYTRFLEKYGQPWAVGYAPSQARDFELDKMAANLARMVREATAVLPYGAKLELLSPPSSTGDQHEAYLKRMDAAISKVLMGQTLTAEVGDKGSYAAAQSHLEVAGEFAEADMDLVVTAFNDLGWYYARLNAGPEEMGPVFGYEETKDLSELADLDAKLYGLGVRFTARHFQNRYSLAQDEFSLIPEAPAEGPGGYFAAPEGPAAAENPDAEYQRALDEAILRYAPKADQNWRAQLEKLMAEAQSFEALETGLAELLGPKAGPEELEEFLADLMFNANLMGRFSEAGKRGHDAGN